MPINDLRGRTFGRLHISNRAQPEIRNRKAYWPCVCECGVEIVARGTHLVAGRIVSCGCWRADPDIRQGAAMAIPAKVRKARAEAGGAATKLRRSCPES